MTLRSEHTPVPVTVEHGIDVGGVLISQGVEIQLRCSCRHDLGYDYGHPQEGQPGDR